jgi:hypothetical protein
VRRFYWGWSLGGCWVGLMRMKRAVWASGGGLPFIDGGGEVEAGNNTARAHGWRLACEPLSDLHTLLAPF